MRREPRGTAEYEEKVDDLDESHLDTLELAEESIISDLARAGPARSHSRRVLSDGTMFDLTVYDELNVMLTFRMLDSERPQFLDFRFYDP